MGLEEQLQVPYLGPRPFERLHKDLFFGRGPEANELLSLIIAHRAVLVYAPSGAGKTSLLNAGLIPLLEGEEFQILPPARVRGLVPEGIAASAIANIYAFNTLLSWAEGEVDPVPLAQTTLAGYLAQQEHPVDDLGLPVPRVAIFDQFEELFTSHPERWQDRDQFFLQVNQALEGDPFLRVVFAMREDYLGQLETYAGLLPERLQTRFRLARLGEAAALEAVIQPLRLTGRRFAAGVAEKLVDELLQARVESSAGHTVVVTGEYIEPVQLQVVCRNLWDGLPLDTTVMERPRFGTRHRQAAVGSQRPQRRRARRGLQPRRQRLVTLGEDATAKLWDAQTGQELFTLAGHPGPVIGGGFSGDGTKLATVSFDSDGNRWLVRVWDVATGAELPLPACQAAQDEHLALSTDFTCLAIGRTDGRVALCDARTGETLWEVDSGLETSAIFDFSHDDTRLVAASQGDVKVFDIASGQELHVFPTRAAAPWFVGFVGPDDGQTQALVVAGIDGQVALWHLPVWRGWRCSRGYRSNQAFGRASRHHFSCSQPGRRHPGRGQRQSHGQTLGRQVVPRAGDAGWP